MSGHSKWSTIKHKKAAVDAKRGKLFTRLIRELTVAARLGGGDSSANPRLRTALADAKANNVPADTIERAVKKGTGELGGEVVEEVIYEGYAPGGVAVLVEAFTDNRNREGGHVRPLGDGAGRVRVRFSEPADVDPRLAQGSGSVRRGEDRRGRAVGLQAAVQKPERVGH